MPDPRKSSHAAAIAGIALAVLLAGYVGAYYAVMRPVLVYNSPRSRERVPAYPVVGPVDWSVLPTIFVLAHQLDRRIRPHVWQPRP